MTHPTSSSIAVGVLALALSGAAWAGSSTASSASSTASQSAGSLSNSLTNSSQSSSGTDRVAQGQYTIVQVVQAEAGADHAQLALLPPSGQQADLVTLKLPLAVVQAQALSAGQVLNVRAREYGLALAKIDAREPFYLLLNDVWLQELNSRPVAL